MKEDVRGAVTWKGITWIARGTQKDVYAAERVGLALTLIRSRW
jgi:hypothetical protein